jgi:hypothetical protein
MDTIMSGSTEELSTLAQCSLAGTNRVFSAAFACAFPASPPPTWLSRDFLAGSRPSAANCF